MAKLVSADTITGITTASDFRDPDKVPPTLSADALIDSIRQRLQQNVAAARAGQFPFGDDGRPQDIAFAMAHHVERLHDFEKILTTVPEGFRLEPVLYCKIDQDVNAQIEREYRYQVRPRFFQFLATHHEEDLRNLGICGHGISRMRQGLEPADSKDRYYQINIDHIIERAGCGQWAGDYSEDPGNPATKVVPQRRVNHFSNLTLLPEQVHNFKNALNDLQDVRYIKPGTSRWMLMMVPERNDTSGFVCAPQKAGGPYTVQFREHDMEQKMRYARHVIHQATAALDFFRANPLVHKTVRTMDEVAALKGKSAAVVANDNADNGRLTRTFNYLISHDARARDYARDYVQPVIRETARSIRQAFNAMAKKQEQAPQKKSIDAFVDFYRSSSLRLLRMQTGRLPLKAASEMHAVLREIDQRLEKMRGARVGGATEDMSRREERRRGQKNRRHGLPHRGRR